MFPMGVSLVHTIGHSKGHKKRWGASNVSYNTVSLTLITTFLTTTILFASR